MLMVFIVGILTYFFTCQLMVSQLDFSEGSLSKCFAYINSKLNVK